MIKKLTLVSIIALSVIMLQSCATVFSGQKTNVRVKNGTPENANVYYNGSLVGQAPVSVKISKNGLKSGNVKIQVKKEGYNTQEVVLTRKLKMGAFVGDIIIFPVGHIVDFVTGAIYKPHPGSVKYSLTVKDGTNNRLSKKYKVGEKVMFTYDKYENQEGTIKALYPDRALIKFTRKNNALQKKTKKEEYTEMEIEVPLINLANLK